METDLDDIVELVAASRAFAASAAFPGVGVGDVASVFADQESRDAADVLSRKPQRTFRDCQANTRAGGPVVDRTTRCVGSTSCWCRGDRPSRRSTSIWPAATPWASTGW